MSQHVADFHEARNQAYAVIFDVRGLASAFRRVRQDGNAAELEEYAAQLESAVNVMGAAFGTEIINSVNRAREATGNMLQVALVMSRIGVAEQE
jgi:hypothetical protein